MQNINLGNDIEISNKKASKDFIGVSINFNSPSSKIQIKKDTVVNVKFEIHSGKGDPTTPIEYHPCESISYYSCLKPDLTGGSSFNFVLPHQCAKSGENKTVELRTSLYLSGEQTSDPAAQTWIFPISLKETSPDIIADQINNWSNRETLSSVSFPRVASIPYPDAQITNVRYDSTEGIAFTVSLGKLAEGEEPRNHFWVGFWFTKYESYGMIYLPITDASQEIKVLLPMPKAPPPNTYPMFSLLFGEHPPVQYDFSPRAMPQ